MVTSTSSDEPEPSSVTYDPADTDCSGPPLAKGGWLSEPEVVTVAYVRVSFMFQEESTTIRETS